jgi:hypothetical protein
VSKWTIYWVLVWGVIGFGAPEVVGIVLNKHDKTPTIKERRTLTENLRMLFATDKDGVRGRYRGLRRFAAIAILGWLAVHIMVVNFV